MATKIIKLRKDIFFILYEHNEQYDCIFKEICDHAWPRDFDPYR